MQITVYGKHLAIGDSLKSHIEQVLHDMTSKRSDRITSAAVTIAKQGTLFLTEIIVHEGTHNHNMVAGHGEDNDPYRSFGLAATKIEKQINKHLDKIKSHHKTDKTEKHLEQFSSNSEVPDQAAINDPLIIAENLSWLDTQKKVT